MTVLGYINRHNKIDTNLKRFKFSFCSPYEFGTDWSCFIISLKILLILTQLYSVLFFSNLSRGRKEAKEKWLPGTLFLVANISTVVDRSVIDDL